MDTLTLGLLNSALRVDIYTVFTFVTREFYILHLHRVYCIFYLFKALSVLSGGGLVGCISVGGSSHTPVTVPYISIPDSKMFKDVQRWGTCWEKKTLSVFPIPQKQIEWWPHPPPACQKVIFLPFSTRLSCTCYKWCTWWLLIIHKTLKVVKTFFFDCNFFKYLRVRDSVFVHLSSSHSSVYGSASNPAKNIVDSRNPPTKIMRFCSKIK